MNVSSSYRYPDVERCINCGWNMQWGKNKNKLSVMYKERVSKLKPAEKELLASWLPSVDKLETHALCRFCKEFLEQSDPSAPRQLNRHSFCVACGDIIPVRGMRFSTLDYQRPDHEHLRPYILIVQDTSAGSSKVCRNCTLKAQREVKLKEEASTTTSTTHDDSHNDTQDTLDWLTTPNTSKGKQCAKTVTLNEYKKVKPKAQACVGCDTTVVKLVTLRTRQQIIMRHKMYVPTDALVCSRHCQASSWPCDVQTDCRYTGEQVADMLFLLKNIRPINFENIEKLDPYEQEKWFGVTSDEFKELLVKAPQLAENKNGRFALAILLACKNSKECKMVVASLSQRSLGDVEEAIKLASQYVKLDKNPNFNLDD